MSHLFSTPIEKESHIVEYVIIGPILGLIPWVVVLLATVVSRALYSWRRPNRSFGLTFACPAPLVLCLYVHNCETLHQEGLFSLKIESTGDSTDLQELSECRLLHFDQP